MYKLLLIALVLTGIAGCSTVKTSNHANVDYDTRFDPNPGFGKIFLYRDSFEGAGRTLSLAINDELVSDGFSGYSHLAIQVRPGVVRLRSMSGSGGIANLSLDISGGEVLFFTVTTYSIGGFAAIAPAFTAVSEELGKRSVLGTRALDLGSSKYSP
jgi:hypothetical protein